MTNFATCDQGVHTCNQMVYITKAFAVQAVSSDVVSAHTVLIQFITAKQLFPWLSGALQQTTEYF